ncbi:ribokinase [Cohnella sp. AR92]|uniref:ribokinase n=1 Tax=Cohnella sp. AR92 TaxID=648716 RepID=UPI000F8CEF96|nr:ribokinase [Cohnella sp. AR92]RUS44970.1 ribokinase [Cohnella sp. AR92]
MGKIVIVGSINMDIVNEVVRFPEPGETIHGRGAAYHPGGKGANQAGAASQAGGEVVMVGAVGSDEFGKVLRSSLRELGVDTTHLKTKQGSSGLAFITVSDSGENQIILSAGSNGELTPDDISNGPFECAAFALLQNEIPLEANLHAMKLCADRGIKVYYNPAPATTIPPEAFPLIDTIVVNETEAAVVSGLEVRTAVDAEAAAYKLRQAGASNVIVTLGGKGAYALDASGVSYQVPAFHVQALDTTAAGDTFIGSYVAAMADGLAVFDALRFASAAAAIAVTRQGSQSSIPTREEIVDFLEG